MRGIAVSAAEVMPVTMAAAIAALASETCEGCGGAKRRRAAVCTRCFRMLHPGMQADLYLMLGHGFERAYAGAMLWLLKKRQARTPTPL